MSSSVPRLGPSDVGAWLLPSMGVIGVLVTGGLVLAAVIRQDAALGGAAIAAFFATAILMWFAFYGIYLSRGTLLELFGRLAMRVSRINLHFLRGYTSARWLLISAAVALVYVLQQNRAHWERWHGGSPPYEGTAWLAQFVVILAIARMMLFPDPERSSSAVWEGAAAAAAYAALLVQAFTLTGMYRSRALAAQVFALFLFALGVAMGEGVAVSPLTVIATLLLILSTGFRKSLV